MIGLLSPCVDSVFEKKVYRTFFGINIVDIVINYFTIKVEVDKHLFIV